MLIELAVTVPAVKLFTLTLVALTVVAETVPAETVPVVVRPVDPTLVELPLESETVRPPEPKEAELVAVVGRATVTLPVEGE